MTKQPLLFGSIFILLILTIALLRHVSLSFALAFPSSKCSRSLALSDFQTHGIDYILEALKLLFCKDKN